jgi:HlyD family secretion protein
VQVSGKIARILVDFNSIVKKGQVIAVLDTTVLYASKVDAYAAMQRAQMQVDLAKSQYVRAKVLFDSSVTARADYDPVVTAYQTANGNLTSARAELNKAKINLQYATIKTPISGIVISRNIQVGNMVIASFNSPTLFTIANNLKKMQVQANVDEADIGQVKVGQAVKFTVDAFPKDIFDGTVTQVRRQPIIVTNVVNYVAIVEVQNPDLKLVPGLTANLNIFIDQRKAVIKIPSNAFSFTPPVEYIQTDILLADSTRKKWLEKIQHDSELRKQEIQEADPTQGFVWVQNGKDIYPLALKKGLSDGTFTEVIGAIKENEEVVVGLNHSAVVTDKKSSSPFMPKFPSKKKK